jgi:hypothetical protein
VFRNNVVGPNPARNDNTFTSYGAGIGSHGSVNNRYMTGIIIEGNQFIDCIFAGVRSWKWVDVTITANTFRGCVRGVHVTPTSFNQTSANNPNGTPSGQGQAGYNYTITGNVFDSYLDIGVFFVSPTFDTANAEPVFYHGQVTITGNTFSNNDANSAVECRWVEGLVIDSNVFKNVFRSIEIQFVVNATVSNNSVTNVERELLLFTETSPAGYSNLGYSRNLAVIGNSGSDIEYSGINIGGAMRGFTVIGNALRNVSTFVATRFGITCNSGARDGYIAGNNIEDAGATNKPVYGVDVTSTCSNVSVGPNKLFGTVGPMRNLASTAPHSNTGPLQINSGKSTDVPGVYLDSFSGTEGEIAVNDATALNFGWWNGSVFTSVLGMTGGGHWVPSNSGVRDLGSASLKWNTVYATTGTINTSDAKEKQQIRCLSQAEKNVAIKLKTLIRAFKFNDSIKEKGEASRVHVGVIAQEVKVTFEEEGLSPYDYGVLCHDSWEEEIDGKVNAKEVYGIRYDELFAFIIAGL